MSRSHVALEQAQGLILESVSPLRDHEVVSLIEALGRVAHGDIAAAVDQPPFPRSPLDGYAMNHRDTAGAADRPVALRVSGSIYAGDTGIRPLLPGEAVRIMTGGMIPEGADCVIRQEETTGDGYTVRISREMQAFENYCFRGEDVKKGDGLVGRGERLGYAHAGVLAGQGIESVAVFRRPVIGLLTTGDEVVPAGSPLLPGKIYNSNLSLLAARLVEIGATPLVLPNAADTPEGIASSVEILLARCDMVITTGGVSVGERDYIPAVVELTGAQLLFHGLDMKPGSPALAAVKDEKLLIGLSGNPFAASATFEVLARPAIGKLGGNRDYMPVRARGIAAGDFGKASPGRRLIRAHMVGQDVFIPEGGHASGMLGTLTRCNCLIDIPADSPPIGRGDPVEVFLL